MAKLEFGIMDGFDAEAGAPPAELYEWHIRYAQQAEQLGHRYYYFIEHQNSPFTCVTSPSVYLAALARETNSLRFGPMVYQLPLYHPVRLAQDAAMVDQLSHGRLEFGIGYGTRVLEFIPWHVDFEQRREMGLEAMDIILKAWQEQKLDYDGEYWQFSGAMAKPKPYQKPHPPVWVGAHSTTSFDYAAKCNFSVAQNIETDAVVAEKFAYWRTAWAAEGHEGPRPHQMLVRHVHVAATDALAREQAEPCMLRGMRGKPRELTPEESNPVMEDVNRVYAETIDDYDFWIRNGLAIVGSPDTVVRNLEEQQRLVGHEIFCAQHQLSGLPAEQADESMRLFGKEVIPAFS